MTDTRVVEAQRESIRQAGGLEPYLNPAAGHTSDLRPFRHDTACE